MFDLRNIISWFKKNFRGRDLLLILTIILFYFATRLILLDGFPIFSDEGIYIHWAKVAQQDAAWRFISLTDGKQPLQTWGTIPLIKLFPNNLLFAGRLFAVMTGFAALTGVFTLCFYLFGKRAAYLGSLFYIFTPYFLFYDRMALVDSGLNAGFIWILFFAILLARTIRLDMALVFGIVSGITLLAKSSAQLFVGLAAFGPILFFEKSKKNFWNKVVNFYVLYIAGVVLALALYNVQRLSPFFHFVSQKNKTFVMTPQQFFQTPFRLFFDNIGKVPLYVFWESAFVLSLFGVIGLIMLFRKNPRLASYLSLWLLIPYGLVTFFSIVLFPRYIIFLGTLLLITATYFFTTIKDKKVFAMFMAAYIISISYFNYTIVADYKNIPFPQTDRGQYIEDWPSGWGMEEIMNHVRQKSEEKPAIIIAEGNFGMAGDVLDTLLKPGDKITIRGVYPFDEKYLFEGQKELNENHVFVVLPHTKPKDIKGHWPIKLIKEYKKPGNKHSLYFYEIVKSL